MDWIIANWIELTGAILGFIYIFLEIKENRIMWPVGLLTSVFYVYVFYVAKFYADMSLQFYYIFISIYGWHIWINGGKKQNKEKLPVSRLDKVLAFKLSGIFIIVFAIISFILVNYTDSPLPYWDSFTTAGSIIATWMLAHKIIEQWWVWIVVNFVSAGLYIYKDLYATTGLFVVYGILCFWGMSEWRKNLD